MYLRYALIYHRTSLCFRPVFAYYILNTDRLVHLVNNFLFLISITQNQCNIYAIPMYGTTRTKHLHRLPQSKYRTANSSATEYRHGLHVGNLGHESEMVNTR